MCPMQVDHISGALDLKILDLKGSSLLVFGCAYRPYFVVIKECFRFLVCS